MQNIHIENTSNQNDPIQIGGYSRIVCRNTAEFPTASKIFKRSWKSLSFDEKVACRTSYRARMADPETKAVYRTLANFKAEEDRKRTKRAAVIAYVTNKRS